MLSSNLHRAWLLIVGLAVASAGCKSNPYCLNCGKSDLGASPVDLASDLATPDDLTVTPPDLTVVGPDGGPCAPTNGGVEICDGLDNDCNGVIDDVDPNTLVGNPNHCGTCANKCDYTAMHEFGACIGGFDGGVPTCVPSGCVPGYVHLPGPAGCNYKCTPTNGGVEICDGIDNDCNGVIDDPFGYPNYNTDLANCGGCGMLCARPGAVAACKTDPISMKGVCGVDHCINNGTDTFRHNPANAMTRDQVGCEYHCPTASTTATSGSNDCDNTVCSFPPEICDGIDNDCNFRIDDSPTDVGTPCGSLCPGGLVANCTGQCTAGTLTCNNGVRVCTNLPGAKGPTPEVCDRVDNDCNGITDDPFGFPSYNIDRNNCGSCGTVCALANAVNKCVTDLAIDATGKGVCEVLQCNSGFNFAPLSPRAGDPAGTCSGGPPGVENGPAGIGCYYACPVNPQAPESCDGKDNNCDGCVDNGLTAPPNFCNNTRGVCSGVPVQPTCPGAGACIAEACTGASGWKCDYSKVPNVNLDAMGNLTAVETFCDGLDNNCNGTTDRDGFPTLGNACSAGTGACRQSGAIACNPGNKLQSGCFNGGVAVAAAPCAARDESCNGKDDDCDGRIDERVPVAGSTCYTDNACNGSHACKGYVDPMVKVGTKYVYEFEATRPDATAASPGGNSSRACANANVLPWNNVQEAQAQAACAAIRDSAGVAMRLCTAPEWQTACEGPTPLPAPGPPVWSLSLARANYVANICNNDDHPAATPGPWPTSTNSGGSLVEFCYTDWSSVDAVPPNRLYDMTGNVMEWTSTTVVAGGNTYFKVRGGAYNAPFGGTTCEFDFDIFPASFANADVGFRCCADNAP